jgi:hypothetical protein
MQRKHAPTGGPEEKISLALEAVNVRKKAGHEGSGDEQAERDEAMIRQSSDQFVCLADVSWYRQRGANVCAQPGASTRTRGHVRGLGKPTIYAQNKVLAIMGHGFLDVQAYWGTGGERGS